MFIAHIPAGYILTKAIAPQKKRLSLMATGLFFSIAPDLDLFWFYLVSDRRVPHHQYISHWPLFWLAVFAVLFILSVFLKRPSWRKYLLVGFSAVMLHLVLDSIAAEIYWLAPFSDFHINLVTVPNVYGWWVKNFFLHWTFAIEVFICLAALILLLHSRKK